MNPVIITVRQVGSRYAVETTGQDATRLNVLNAKSLEWNLKHVFGFKSKEIKQVFAALQTTDMVYLERVAA